MQIATSCRLAKFLMYRNGWGINSKQIWTWDTCYWLSFSPHIAPATSEFTHPLVSKSHMKHCQESQVGLGVSGWHRLCYIYKYHISVCVCLCGNPWSCLPATYRDLSGCMAQGSHIYGEFGLRFAAPRDGKDSITSKTCLKAEPVSNVWNYIVLYCIIFWNPNIVAVKPEEAPQKYFENEKGRSRCVFPIEENQPVLTSIVDNFRAVLLSVSFNPAQSILMCQKCATLSWKPTSRLPRPPCESPAGSEWLQSTVRLVPTSSPT